LAQRVQAHIQQCHACQDYLADLDAGGRAVRRDEAPQLQDAIWGDVRGRITPTGAGKRRATNARLPIIAGGLAATALLVTIFAVVIAMLGRNTTPNTSSTFATTPHPGRTGTPAHQATATSAPVLALKPGPNWQAASVPNGVSVAFSATNPLTGYACAFINGTPYSSLRLYATHDGGATWQAAAGLVTGGQCRLTINPTNPLDVTMQVSKCSVATLCNGELPYAYRTLDGGQSWAQLSLPPGAEGVYTDVGGATYNRGPIYAGDALFVFASTGASSAPITPSLKHQIAVSINDQPFTWVDLTNVVSLNHGVGYAIGNAFFIIARDPNQPLIKKTTDGGVTWTTIIAQGIRPVELNAIFDVATTNNAVYILADQVSTSVDGSQTWVATGPTVAPSDTFFMVAPDGTLYVAIFEQSLYRRIPNATAWQQIATNRQIIAVSWNADGHPVALWDDRLVINNQVPTTYLEYQAP